MEHISYAIGTVVKVISGNLTGRIGVVNAVAINENASVFYGVDGYAWLEHYELEFVSNPTIDSLKKAAEWNSESEDEDFDDEDEDDYEDDGD